MRMLKSFSNAFRGIFLLIRSERNFQIHIGAFILVTTAGIYFDIHPGEWGLILIMSALVMSLEAINTSIEKLCDHITLEKKESIRNIKDIAAGAVLISSIAAVVMAVIIFYHHIANLIS